MSLNVGRKMQQFGFGELFGMHGVYFEYTVGKGSGFIEYHCSSLGQGIHIISTFDEDSAMRSSADSAEKCERNGNNQGARTAYDEEGEGAIKPGCKGIAIRGIEEWRNKGQY